MRFLATIIASCLIGLFSIGLLNFMVDPTGIRSLSHPDSNPFCGSGMRTERRWTLPLSIAHNPAGIVLSGTSRMLRGFDENDVRAFFQGQPVLNAALPGATMEDLYALLMPGIRSGSIHRMMLGMEFGLFSGSVSNMQHAMTEHSDQWAFLQNRTKPLMSLEASEASLAAVLKQCPSSHSSASGFRSARTYRKKSRSLPEDFIHESEKNILSRYQQPNSEARYQSRLQLLEQLLQEACDHGIAIELIIPPLHQRIHNIHDTLNLQNDIQRWKDHLFSAAKKRRDAGCSVNMTDFSELNEITQSRLTLKNERADDSSNPWFYEPSHFTPTTGKCILASLRGNKKACTKQAFGTTRL